MNIFLTLRKPYRPYINVDAKHIHFYYRLSIVILIFDELIRNGHKATKPTTYFQ